MAGGRQERTDSPAAGGGLHLKGRNEEEDCGEAAVAACRGGTTRQRRPPARPGAGRHNCARGQRPCASAQHVAVTVGSEQWLRPPVRDRNRQAGTPQAARGQRHGARPRKARRRPELISPTYRELCGAPVDRFGPSRILPPCARTWPIQCSVPSDHISAKRYPCPPTPPTASSGSKPYLRKQGLPFDALPQGRRRHVPPSDPHLGTLCWVEGIPCQGVDEKPDILRGRQDRLVRSARN